MLEDLKKQLSAFQYQEETILTTEERDILKEMFAVKGSFKALYKHMCAMESQNGTSMVYDIEQIPDGGYTDREIVDFIRFKKMSTQFIRSKLEALRTTFALDLSKEVEAEEIKIKEEQEKIDKERAERELETNGVSPDM